MAALAPLDAVRANGDEPAEGVAVTSLRLFELTATPVATDPDAIKGGTVVRVAVPALPDNDATLAGATRACWAEWRALEWLGYDITCICSDGTRSGEWCQDPYDHGLNMNCGIPWGWEDEPVCVWHIPTLLRFDPSIDPRYAVAVVKVT